MISPYFEVWRGTHRLEIGRFRVLRLTGSYLKGDDQQIAVHRAGVWKAQGTFYAALVVPAAVDLYAAEPDSPDRLRLKQIRIADGSIWDESEHVLIAWLDPSTDDWHLHTRGTVHEVLVITGAGEPLPDRAETGVDTVRGQSDASRRTPGADTPVAVRQVIADRSPVEVSPVPAR